MPGGPGKPSRLAEGTPREQGGWPGARSPSLKLLLGLAARPGAPRKARSRLLCCLASCSMVSSRWTRCSCSYCRARCHFRLCVSASSRKSLQAWRGGWPVSREGGPGGPSPKGSETLLLPPAPVMGQETPGFSEPAWCPPWLAAGTPVHRQRLYCLSRRGSPQFQQRNWDSEFCTRLAHSYHKFPSDLWPAVPARFCPACWVHRWFRHPLRKQGMVVLPPSPQWRGGSGPLLSLEGRVPSRTPLDLPFLDPSNVVRRDTGSQPKRHWWSQAATLHSHCAP